MENLTVNAGEMNEVLNCNNIPEGKLQVLCLVSWFQSLSLSFFLIPIAQGVNVEVNDLTDEVILFTTTAPRPFL